MPTIGRPLKVFFCTLTILSGSMCAPAFVSVLCPSPIKTTTYQRGSGTANDPYILCSVAHFQNIASNPSAYFTLGKNLDFTGQTFTPFATFTGTLDGGSFRLTNISISGAGNTGLIEALNGNIRNLSIGGTAAATVGGIVGMLAGVVSGGTIDNVHSSGSVSAITGGAGGLLGLASGPITISNCSSSASVVSSNTGNSGGFAGGFGLGVEVSNSHATGNVDGGTGDAIGGFVGLVSGAPVEITGSSATGAVSATGIGVGGFAGAIYTGTISDSFATGDVSAGNGAGGFIGSASANASTITTSYATGDASALAFLAGGFIGYCDFCSISDSYAVGGAVSAGVMNAGGFMGGNGITIGSVVRSFSASVSVTSGGATGGFVAVDNFAGAMIDETTCFWDSTLVAAAGADGTGQSTVNMQTPGVFSTAGYSDAVWNLSGHSGGYLKLR